MGTYIGFSFGPLYTSYKVYSISAENDYGPKSSLTKPRGFTYLETLKTRPEYHAACKFDYRPIILIAFTADAFEALKKGVHVFQLTAHQTACKKAKTCANVHKGPSSIDCKSDCTRMVLSRWFFRRENPAGTAISVLFLHRAVPQRRLRTRFPRILPGGYPLWVSANLMFNPWTRPDLPITAISSIGYSGTHRQYVRVLGYPDTWYPGIRELVASVKWHGSSSPMPNLPPPSLVKLAALSMTTTPTNLLGFKI